MTNKTELNWINVQAASLTGEPRKAYDALVKARETFKQVMIEQARKAKVLDASQTLVINHKAWGFGMAKAQTKTAQAQAKGSDMFASL